MSKEKDEAFITFISKILDGDDFTETLNDTSNRYYQNGYSIGGGLIVVYD